jgi:cell division protein FtsI/penicillin-binding protein 2
LPEDVADNLRETVDGHWIQGFDFQNSIKRWYTAPDLATHVIGFTGEVEETDEDGKPETRVVGRFGVEYSMEEFLAGRDGWREHCRDARGLGGSRERRQPAAAARRPQRPAHLDMGLQAIVEEELDACLAEFESEQGAVIMMDPKTGEILAMASRPNFDLNHKENIAENGFNYAIQAIYEPGSTIKMVATGRRAQRGLVTPFTSMFCHNGVFRNGKIVVRDHHPYGMLTYEGVSSRNPTTSAPTSSPTTRNRNVSTIISINWGFGSKTGIQLSGESSGIARNTGNAVDFSRVCFGYAANVTPLQWPAPTRRSPATDTCSNPGSSSRSSPTTAPSSKTTSRKSSIA